MKNFMIAYTLLSSMSAFATSNNITPSELALKFDLRTTVVNSFKNLKVKSIEYSTDGNSLNVFSDLNDCYRVNLVEQEKDGIKKLVVTQSTRDYSCDKPISLLSLSRSYRMEEPRTPITEEPKRKKPVKLALKYDLKTAVENSFKNINIKSIEYSEDNLALNVFFDETNCYRATLGEIEKNGLKKLVVTRSIRDYRCDKIVGY